MEKIIKIDGKQYTLTSDDNYLNYMGDNFEPCMVDLFKCLIQPEYVVADIGSNVGLTSILFSNLASKVYSFEPSPTTFTILKENLIRANTQNVEAVNLGLGAKNESLTITFSKDNRSGGFISNLIKPVTGHVTEDISILTLDNFLSSKSDRLDFIKIDVEGFEMNVIKWGIESIKKYHPIVALELNHFCLNILHRINVPDFLDYLRSIFPYLYAVDKDNMLIADLHIEDHSYHVMREHLMHFGFPNIVGGFDTKLSVTLSELELKARTEFSKK